MTTAKPHDWPGFLAQIGGASRVTLVGPMHDRSVDVSEPTVFVDGGARFMGNLGGAPSIRVGDGDSGVADLDVRLPAEKDFSDLAFVLRELPVAVVALRLLGFLGGRLDHMLANLGELHGFLARRSSGLVELEGSGVVGGRAGVQIVGFVGSLELRISGVFSVMVLESCEVRIEGECKYPLKSTTLPPASSHGLSNEGHGLVRFSSRGPCFVLLGER